MLTGAALPGLNRRGGFFCGVGKTGFSRPDPICNEHEVIAMNANQMTCTFCSMNTSKVILVNSHAVAIYDNYPVSPGHTLIVPKRHIASFFEASKEEQAALLELLSEMQQLLQKERNPAGFNIGINDGAAAGQTVMHLHIHLIPRYVGDQPDPRGGVRWLFPDKAPYWSTI